MIGFILLLAFLTFISLPVGEVIYTSFFCNPENYWYVVVSVAMVHAQLIYILKEINDKYTDHRKAKMRREKSISFVLFVVFTLYFTLNVKEGSSTMFLWGSVTLAVTMTELTSIPIKILIARGTSIEKEDPPE